MYDRKGTVGICNQFAFNAQMLKTQLPGIYAKDMIHSLNCHLAAIFGEIVAIFFLALRRLSAFILCFDRHADCQLRRGFGQSANGLGVQQYTSQRMHGVCIVPTAQTIVIVVL